MDIKQMIYFKTIVEEGTISQAAKTLHMAQPPLSMQLKQLEEELGTLLIQRGHHKLELTNAGRLFYRRCLQIIQLTDQVKQEIADTHHKVLNIGVTSSNSGLLPHLIEPFIQEHPQLSFHIHEGTTYELIDLLLSRHIDLGIVRTPFDATQLHTHYFSYEPMVAIGHSRYFKENASCIHDFQNTPLIIHQRYLSLITDYCIHQNFNPYIRMTCDDARSSLIWATHGHGVAIIPQGLLHSNHHSSLQHIILQDKELYTRLAFITRKNEMVEPILQELINILI